MGEVSEVVEAVLYLESAASVTGETLHVDGGAHAGHWKHLRRRRCRPPHTRGQRRHRSRQRLRPSPLRGSEPQPPTLGRCPSFAPYSSSIAERAFGKDVTTLPRQLTPASTAGNLLRLQGTFRHAFCPAQRGDECAKPKSG